MKTRPALASAALLLLALAAPAHASEDSERLYSRGLVELHSGRTDAALALFDRAVAADPSDVRALYQRGVARAKLNDLAGARSDLQAVLTKDPQIKQAELELGIVEVQAGAYDAARPHLERAAADSALAGSAAFFLGVADLQQDRPTTARAHFARAEAAGGAEATSAKYYLGVIAWREGERAAAADYFRAVTQASPGSAIGREARKFLDEMAGGGEPAAPGKAWEVFGQAGFEYDTNVVLAPTDQVTKQQLGLGKQNDGRAVLGAGVVYVPWASSRAQLSIGYEFYQSLQFELTDFNLQDHRPSVQLVNDLGYAQVGFFARYDYYRLGGSSFLSQGTMSPFVLVPEGEFGRTEVFYRAQGNDFLDSPYEGVLDGWTLSPGVRQFFYLGDPDRALFVGYRYGQFIANELAGEQYEYEGNEASVGAVVGWGPYAAEVTYAYRHEDYAQLASGGRVDHAHLPQVALRWNFMEHFWLTGAFLGAWNDSNQPDFDYDRQIGSITVQARY